MDEIMAPETGHNLILASSILHALPKNDHLPKQNTAIISRPLTIESVGSQAIPYYA